jgi:hypothetical protein
VITDTQTLITVGVEETLIAIEEDGKQLFVPGDTVEVIEVGRGPPGPAGPSGAGVIEIPFAFGDATPKTLLTTGAGKTVYGAGIHIYTGFDGAGASLQIGDAGDPARLMKTSENDPAQIGSYLTAPNYRYASATVLLLTITPGGGASQGAGIVTLQVQQ